MTNRVRGEAAFVIEGQERTLRPTFAALVAAEDELGPLFALVERAAKGSCACPRLPRCSGTASRIAVRSPERIWAKR